MPTAFGQCVTGGLYPDTAFTPACSGTQEIVNTDCWAGEYAQINVTANNQYVFASSTATDFITVTDGAGSTIYAFGTSPVSWNSNSVSGVIRYYIHKTSGCVAENIGRIRYITCTPGGCGQPSGLNVTNITSNSARLNWSAPGTAPSVGYDYYVSTSNVTPIATTVPTGTVASTLNSLTALTASTTYFYWVRSNCNATKSAWVSGGSFTTIAFQACNGASYELYPETTFTPAYTGSFEEITADAWAGEYSNINILANKQYTFTSSVGTDYVTVTNATGTVVYATGTSPVIWNSGNVTGVIRYYLHANSSCGDNSVSRQKGIVATDTCNQPATLASSNVTSSSATLTWSTPSVPSGGYDYYISTSSTAPNAATTPSGNLNANNITFNGTLAASTTYYWWVRSNCGATKSAWSGPITFTTLAVPVGCTTGTLWPSTTYTPQCTGAQELIVNNAYGGEYTNISVPNNYKRLTFASSVSTDFITITNATGTQVLAYGTTPVVYNVENAPVTLRYYIHTNSACGTQNINRNRYITCDNTVCVSPISLTSSNVTSSGALLSWNFSTSQAANYEFYVSTSSAVAPQYTTAPTGSSPTLAAPIGNLNPSTTYYFWVRSACNNTDKSNWVYGGSFTTLAATVCGDPTNVSIINVTSNSAFVSLTAPSPFPTSGYQYYFAGTNVAPNSATTPTGTFPAVGQANITGLNPSQTYYAWIRSACGGSSVGNWVSAGSFTTVVAASCNGTTGVFGVYPPGTFTIPNCDGSAQVISTASWAGEYANVNITAGKYYTFTSSVATDYLTITNATGNIVFASGQTPVVWYSGTTTGTIRYFMHTNANCGAEQVNRTRSVSCEAPVVGLVGTAALGWGTDVFMSSVDGVNFTLNNYTLTTGEVKFRLNGAWNLNWGGATFPTGTGIQDGQNIPVVGCTYNITFNLNTKAYTFTTTSTSPSAPTGSANQIVCNNPTLASFTVTGTNIKWYTAATGGTLLAANTPVTTGTTYYASQSNGTCESPMRLAVTAIATPLPTASATQTFCTGATVANLQATGTALKWYNVPANGTALTGATVLAAGTYYV
ncbi:MAG TPA: fibronectin type III domain-containing protein, partial [Flavobacterium sp.]|nr:fibronectin type III domain-containing protein [Flavobacterium sp.]